DPCEPSWARIDVIEPGPMRGDKLFVVTMPSCIKRSSRAMKDGNVRDDCHRMSCIAGAESKIGVVQMETVEAMCIEADCFGHIAARGDHASVEQPDAVDAAGRRAPHE